MLSAKKGLLANFPNFSGNKETQYVAAGYQRGRIADAKMKYMVIETFRPGMTDRVYARFREKGRMLPPGVVYIDSWLSRDRMRCFQLMSADRPEFLQEWMSRWKDLVDFEVVPVQDSPTRTEAAAGHR